MKRFHQFLLLIVLISSCGEKQDFEQIEDLSLEPNFASSIFYFESDEETINTAGTGGFYNEVFTFEAFNDPNIADRVLDGVITYQVENTTSKSLSLQIEF